MGVPVVEDEPYLVAADRDGLRRTAIVERISVVGCDNQVGGSDRRPRRPLHRFRPGSPGRRSSHFSLADVNSGEPPQYWMLPSATGGAWVARDARDRAPARAGPL
jgi:hypothetical protein